MRRHILFFCLTLACLAGLATAARAQVLAPGNAALGRTGYAAREEVQRFAQEAAARLELDEAWILKALEQAQFRPAIQKLMRPPVQTADAPDAAPARDWRRYRAQFIEPLRMAAGAQFWQDNRLALERARHVYGVPPELIVGILGVETFYGRRTGNHRVLDALATLAFDFPPEHPRAAARSAYFRSELEAFLLHSYRNGIRPDAPRGSFAGAWGLPQFMPGNIGRYGVDFDGDGRVDLMNATDAIGSVAQYMQAHGWQKGQPVWFAVRLADDADMATLLAPDIRPSFTLAQMRELGVLPEAADAHAGLLALVELPNGAAPASYVAGTENFYAITRYNQSSFYAMAVEELGREVRDLYEVLYTQPSEAESAGEGETTSAGDDEGLEEE